MSCPNNRKGYIAITSAVILVLIVMTVGIIFSHSSFLGRFDSLGLENKDASREAAQGCLEYARLRLKQGSYGGNETVSIGSSTCFIPTVQISGNYKIIQASSSADGRVTNLELTLTSTTLDAVSLSEVQKF